MVRNPTSFAGSTFHSLLFPESTYSSQLTSPLLSFYEDQLDQCRGEPAQLAENKTLAPVRIVRSNADHGGPPRPRQVLAREGFFTTRGLRDVSIFVLSAPYPCDPPQVAAIFSGSPQDDPGLCRSLWLYKAASPSRYKLGGDAMVRDGVLNMVDRLRERGLDPRRIGGDAWEARCPAHRGADHSLAISRNEFNHVVLACRSTENCQHTRIIRALGWTNDHRPFSRPLNLPNPHPIFALR
jgi:hypothetical protein